MAIAEMQKIVELPQWYLRLGRRLVHDPYSGLSIDLFRLDCVAERLTELSAGDRLCCDFVTDDPSVPVTSFYDEEKRIWIHIRRGGKGLAGYVSDVHDNSPKLLKEKTMTKQNDERALLATAKCPQGEPAKLKSKHGWEKDSRERTERLRRNYGTKNVPTHAGEA